MSEQVDDPMWEEFKPLWIDLQQAGGLLLVVGGYGLYLKQRWLRTQLDIPTAVPLARWRDITPRVTKDVDIVVSLELLASEEAQAKLVEALSANQFKAQNPRWQFCKEVGANRKILVEFHAQRSSPEHENLDNTGFRVKHKPSLGTAGIHGRLNSEAVGCHHHPFKFVMDGVGIQVPNPITWCLMKLVAMQERWTLSEQEADTFNREQAMKHARDVCRAVALVTRDERDLSGETIAVIQATTEFQKACQINAEFFAPNGWGTRIAAAMWEVDDFITIRQILADWFQE